MPKPGDRVVVEGTKVGGGRREGTLVENVGSLIKIRWTDGGETIMAPGAGAVRFLPASAKAASKKASANPAKVTAKAKAASKGGKTKKR